MANERSSTRRTPEGEASARAGWLVPTCLAMITIVAFLPALGNGFVSWDDQKNFLDNPHYRGLGLAQLSWMWTTFHMGHYVPLSWMTLGADYVLWGMNPAGYHATSIALHAANTVVLYFLARRLFALAATREVDTATGSLTRFTTPAVFAALFFALHPLRVESVVWITERRDTLSLLFYQLTVLAYLRAQDDAETRPRWYALSIAAFACALLSKATAVTAPAVLALLNVYPLRRITLRGWHGAAARRVAAEIAPFAVLSAGFIALSIVALHPPDQLSSAAKLAVSAYSLHLYLLLTAMPAGLSPLYEMPLRVDPLAAAFLIAYTTCAVYGVVAWLMRRRFPGATTALAAFVIMTLPMLGIVQNGPQIAANRYTYHGAPALAMLLGGLLVTLPVPVVARRLAAGVVLAVLAGLTWRHTQVWHDSESLWSRVLAEDPNSAIGHSAMATVRYSQGRLEEGLEHSRRAVKLAPAYPEAYNDLGVGLARQGQIAEAAEQFRHAIAIQPTYDEAYGNLGIVTGKRGDLAAAIGLYQHALELNPDYPDAQVNWGNTLVRAGRPSQAIPHYKEALRIRPTHADARHNWGVALAREGRFAEAADQFRAALAIDPNHAEARAYLAQAERRLGSR